MRYRFKRSSPLYVLAVLLYFAGAVFFFFPGMESEMALFLVLYVLAGLAALFFAKGKKQWLLILPLGALAAFFLGVMIGFAGDAHHDHDLSVVLYPVSYILYGIGFLTFFVSLFAPTVRYISAGACLLAFLVFVVMMGFLEGAIADGITDIGIMFIVSFFMVPQALHALTPRVQA